MSMGKFLPFLPSMLKYEMYFSLSNEIWEKSSLKKIVDKIPNTQSLGTKPREMDFRSFES